MRIFAIILLLISGTSYGQVPVREEPRHKPVLVNQYVRMLDVKIPPGDTTLYHVHETPSLFLTFTNTYMATQVKDSMWSERYRSIKGSVAWDYFSNTRTHRVSNQDKDTFHVTDIEILSEYRPADGRKPLPLELLFDNERSFAYRITEMGNGKITFSRRGPIIAALVDGGEVELHTKDEKTARTLNIGGFAYIEPESTFYFTSSSKRKFDLVIFEIK